LKASLEVQAGIALMAAAFDLHDDIIDNSKMKHGLETVFGKYGKEIALLLGNAFLIEGFTHFVESLDELYQVKDEEIVEILKSSLFELGNAHALELNLKRRVNATPNECMDVVNLKAASIEADMRIGAIVGGGSNSQIEALAKYGRILGVLATLREEFVDVFDIEELNQRVLEYPPIPVFYAMQDSPSKARIKGILAKRRFTSEDVEELAELVLKTKSVERLKKDMLNLATEAASLLSQFKESRLQHQLAKLALSSLDDL
jgi:geranylgeranyl pyrophosphate synthase